MLIKERTDIEWLEEQLKKEDFWENVCVATNGDIYLVNKYAIHGYNHHIPSLYVRSCKNFFISRLNLCKKKYEETGDEHWKYMLLLGLMTEELNGDFELAEMMIDFNIEAYKYFNIKIRQNKELIRKYIQFVQEVKDGEGKFIYELNYVPTTDSFNFAYEMCQILPEYKQCFSSSLNKRLEGMSINDYYEKYYLKKSLKKDLSKKEVSKPIRNKI
ncbi:hypothetical protein [Burkholderia cepacia]|uniref:hypothetical protein n=1 Tax=Burkholderia cepacia TaxID=292 RepID=UPI00158BE38E|nr:hypothetical protein [Burkholderia cepacia]